MSKESGGQTIPELTRLEHDDSGGVPTKRVLLYGWDGLDKRRIAADANGGLQSTKPAYASKITVSGNYTYIAKAPAGSAQASAVWQAKRIEVSGSDTTTTWANGDTNFDNVATDLTTLTYS